MVNFWQSDEYALGVEAGRIACAEIMQQEIDRLRGALRKIAMAQGNEIKIAREALGYGLPEDK